MQCTSAKTTNWDYSCFCNWKNKACASNSERKAVKKIKRYWKKTNNISQRKERRSEEQFQYCYHIRSPVDVGNTRHIHNAIIHQHQDKKMNGIPWRQQSECLDNFCVTWRDWQFRVKEQFPTRMAQMWFCIRVWENMDYHNDIFIAWIPNID